MTIAEARRKCKSFTECIPRDLLILALVVSASTFSFGFGYLAGLDAEQEDGVRLEKTSGVATSSQEQVVASKSGMKYYLPWCAGVERISDANKVWFASASFARAAGYAPAANCKGL
ncbi:TPA: hypothetical protein DIV48_00440 [Candidatus Kaiserbacteria bacterium]|nr:MAG: hypothetical protein UY93_C0002G0252 [Parcubacteria group bacterium GW2011_GWA1_56_13]KKW46039.1 MAG: hypothetical protein UY97_C0011G0007 [Parcubacteria group bacterium GW2011_GWB1_57_6]HCR52100.1 hypothetical protein [Candidatus Kaiserbacteria bacterium]